MKDLSGEIKINDTISVSNEQLYIGNDTTTFFRFKQPLIFIWNPKEDITTYELALCLNYINNNSIYPENINKEDKIFRHFDIIDPNE